MTFKRHKKEQKFDIKMSCGGGVEWIEEGRVGGVDGREIFHCKEGWVSLFWADMDTGEFKGALV